MQRIDRQINKEVHIIKYEIKRNEKTIQGFRSINNDLHQKLNQIEMIMAEKPLIYGAPFEYHERQIISSGWTPRNAELVQIAMEEIF